MYVTKQYCRNVPQCYDKGTEKWIFFCLLDYSTYHSCGPGPTIRFLYRTVNYFTSNIFILCFYRMRNKYILPITARILLIYVCNTAFVILTNKIGNVIRYYEQCTTYCVRGEGRMCRVENRKLLRNRLIFTSPPHHTSFSLSQQVVLSLILSVSTDRPF